VSVVAHIAGVPVEELIPTLAGAGSLVLLARSRLTSQLRLRRNRFSRDFRGDGAS
jgi:hypothetical protein